MRELPELHLPDQQAWSDWLSEHGASAPGVWLVHTRKGVEPASVSYAQAVEECLRHGWIDGQRASRDESTYRQRYTPRTRKSPWSQVNRAKVLALLEQGRMLPAGLAAVEAAQADGRWDRAYEPPSTATVPPDFQAALDASPSAAAFFATLTGMRRYAFLYRIQDAKRPETRARRIALFVQTLERGEVLR